MQAAAEYVIKKLLSAGYQAYYVGGCVRDRLLGIPFDDVDIATNARPESVIGLFDKVIPSGLKYGTVTVLRAEQAIEVTTYRRDYDYADGRRPTIVAFSDTLEEDLVRRDFTINAMAMSQDGALIDFFGGQNDLELRIIRTVGEPAERFKEDALRKLRAVRFAAQKNFKLEAALFDELKRNPTLEGVSVERIFEELNKILLSNAAAYGLNLLADCGLLFQIYPKLADMVGFDQCNPHHKYDLFQHTLKVVEGVPATLELRWAALLHDVGKLDTMTVGADGVGHFYGHQQQSVVWAKRILKHFKASKALTDSVVNLVDYHMYKPVVKAKPIRRWINKIGKDNISDMIALMRADMIATGTLDGSFCETLSAEVDSVLTAGAVFSRTDLAVDGHDLMAKFESLKEQPKLLKPLFNSLVECCLEKPEQNTKARLLKIAERWLADHDGQINHKKE